MRYLPVVLGALLILVLSCTTPVTLTTPVVSDIPLTDGGTLRLTWTAVSGATGYYVYLDGTKNTVTAGSYSYDVTTPTKQIQVSAYDASGNESGKWQVTTSIVKTSSIVVYTTADAGQGNHAFYFNSSGTGVPIPFTQASDIDFVLDTSGSVSNIQIRSPNSYTPVYNSKGNATVAAAATDFDQLQIAAATGTYNTVTTISSNGLYSGWIDPTNNGWSTDDQFCKIKIENISGTAVTMTTGYQPIGGLRWLISL